MDLICPARTWDECKGGRKELICAGTKFVVLHSLGHPGLDDLTRKVYEICEYKSMPSDLLGFPSGITEMRGDWRADADV
jgi:hypothetical protein